MSSPMSEAAQAMAAFILSVSVISMKLCVRTKFRKHATSFILNIPELIEVVVDWDDFVRSQLTNDHPWFANISPETG